MPAVTPRTKSARRHDSWLQYGGTAVKKLGTHPTSKTVDRRITGRCQPSAWRGKACVPILVPALPSPFPDIGFARRMAECKQTHQPRLL
jgi:hypothetical protein